MAPEPVILPSILEDGPADLVGQLLREQQDMSAVDRFARAHDACALKPGGIYRDLMPVTAPARGQQYAFEVDLDACTGCKACVAGCHSLNGLGDNEAWRKVGAIHGGNPALPMLQHVTTACHHCLEPACMLGCPAKAYEKDPQTGIVRHLDDQCIGCRYCELTCPYEVPQFNAVLGIVRKCDMCSQRLGAGEAPACVQSCPNEAIRIVVVDQQAAKKAAAVNFMPIAGAPDTSHTLPTTRYRTRKSWWREEIARVDQGALPLGEAHPPLTAMLVLTQISAGATVAAAAAARMPTDSASAALLAVFAILAGAAGMVAATLHLGRPLYAFRAVLGWRRSWLSREVIAFGAYMPALSGAAFFAVLEVWPGLVIVPFPIPFPLERLLGAAALLGLAGVACSACIYMVTPRPAWAHPRTAGKFLLTTWGGCCAASAIAAAFLGNTPAGINPRVWCALWVAGTVAKFILEGWLQFSRPQNALLAKTPRLLQGRLHLLAGRRWMLGAFGGVALPLLLALGADLWSGPALGAAFLALLAFFLWAAGEFAERHLFFIATAHTSMPGGTP